MRLAALSFFAAAPLAGCSATGELGAPATGSPQLVVVAPTAGYPVASPALGLHYRQVGALYVRRFDGVGRPDPGVAVSFTPSGTTGGTALASDITVTDPDGVATMPISAGFEEATFRVVASSSGAEDLSFDVTVSRYPFVDVVARLAWPAGDAGPPTMRALVYADRPCSRLPPARSEPPPFRQGVSAGPKATIDFSSLRAADYAIVGRAEDAAGRLLARGCVDLLAGQLTGGTLQVPVPLVTPAPALAPAYRLESTFSFVFVGDSPIASWDAIATCPFGLAQALIDAIGDALGPGPLVDRLSAHRGPLDGAGCRPAQSRGKASLDAQLSSLLVKQGSPASLLPAVVADLDAVVNSAAVESQLALSAAGSASVGWVASHALSRVTLAGAGGAKPATYSPATLGVPVPSVDSIQVGFDGETITIAEHGLTLRLPVLWGRALGDVALTPRGLPADVTALLATMVGAAEQPANNSVLHGCDAVENLLCMAGEVGGGCALATACQQATVALAAGLAAPFAAPAGFDLRLAGRATGVDRDGDLVVETLASGDFASFVGIAPTRMVPVTAPFSAAQIPIQ